MKYSTTILCLTLAVAGASAHELPSRYALARRGSQFVGGTCKQDSDCQQGCCAFNTGKCAGPAFAQEQFGGCGHGNAKPNCNVAAALKLDDCIKGAVNGDLSSPAIQAAAEFVAKLDGFKFTPIKASGGGAAPAKPATKPKATKTTTTKKSTATSSSKSISALAAKQSSLKTVFESCKADSDCQQGCCAFNSGKCAGPGIAQTRDGGCGHGNAKPNCDVATALNLGVCAKGSQNGDIHSAKVQQAAAFVSILDKLPFKPS